LEYKLKQPESEIKLMSYKMAKKRFNQYIKYKEEIARKIRGKGKVPTAGTNN
jgi:hypothetical protein